MKINNMWGGEYTAPALEELNVMVENGFAASLQFGEEGDPGQNGSVIYYDGEL